MHMTGSNSVLSVPTEHLPGLIVLVILIPVIWMALCGVRALASHGSRRAKDLLRRFDGLTFSAKAVLFAALVGALVHAAIVPTHWGDQHVTAILFMFSAVGFALVFWWTFNSRLYWRTASVAMFAGTAGAYAFYILRGWETMDPVGLLTTTIELAAVLILLSPVPAPAGSSHRERWLAVAAVPLAMVTLLGTATIASAASAASAATSAAQEHRLHLARRMRQPAPRCNHPSTDTPQVSSRRPPPGS